MDQQPMDNQQGAGVLRHVGPAMKKAKKKKVPPPSNPATPMSQGMSGMDDDSEY